MLALLMLPAAPAAESPSIDPQAMELRRLETRLADGTTIVASEGVVEPRSVGSVVLAHVASVEGLLPTTDAVQALGKAAAKR